MDSLHIWDNRSKLFGALTADMLQEQYRNNPVTWSRAEQPSTDGTYDVTIRGEHAPLDREIRIGFAPGYQWEYDMPAAVFFGLTPQTADAANWAAFLAHARLRAEEVGKARDEFGRIVYSHPQVQAALLSGRINAWHGSKAISEQIGPQGERTYISIGENLEDHIAFCIKQNSIYGKFQHVNYGVDPKSALKPAKFLDQNEGASGLSAYILALRFGPEVTDRVAQAAEATRGVVPSIGYDAANAHMTVMVMNQQSSIAAADEKLMEQSLQLAQEYAPRFASCPEGYVNAITPSAKFDHHTCGWAFNEDTVVLKGHANSLFTDLVKYVAARQPASAPDLQLKGPWGASLTTARFLEHATGEQVQELGERLKSIPLPGVVLPTHLDVGHFQLDREGFRLNVYRSLKFAI